jgi:hypothetical protein
MDFETDEDRETPEESERFMDFETDEDRETPEESERFMDFETDEDRETPEESERFMDFEMGPENPYAESREYDPLVEKFSQRLFEIASHDSSKDYEIDTNTENELGEFVDDLQREMFGGWFKKAWKVAKKTYKAANRFRNSTLGKTIFNLVKTGVPALNAIDIASKVLTGPASGPITNLLSQGIHAASTGLIPGGTAGANVLNALGISPGAGLDANKEGLKNIVQAASDNYKQLANQAVNNPAAGDPVEAPKIAATENETSINKILKGTYSTAATANAMRSTQAGLAHRKGVRIKRTKRIRIPSNAQYIRVSFYKYV